MKKLIAFVALLIFALALPVLAGDLYPDWDDSWQTLTDSTTLTDGPGGADYIGTVTLDGAYYGILFAVCWDVTGDAPSTDLGIAFYPTSGDTGYAVPLIQGGITDTEYLAQKKTDGSGMTVFFIVENWPDVSAGVSQESRSGNNVVRILYKRWKGEYN